MKLTKTSILKLFIIVLVIFTCSSVFYYLGKEVNAQGKKITSMRCTPVNLIGAQTYDVVTKKVIPQRRTVVINRCVGEDVVCFQSFDQGGSLTCMKK